MLLNTDIKGCSFLGLVHDVKKIMNYPLDQMIFRRMKRKETSFNGQTSDEPAESELLFVNAIHMYCIMYVVNQSSDYTMH